MDTFEKHLTFLCSLRWLPLPPDVIAVGGDVQHTTYGFHQTDGLVRTHKFEDFSGTVSVPRAHQATALGKICLVSNSDCLIQLAE